MYKLMKINVPVIMYNWDAY